MAKHVAGIVRLWKNVDMNSFWLGCLIIILTHSPLIKIRTILIIQDAKSCHFKAHVISNLIGTKDYTVNLSKISHRLTESGF